MTALDFARVEVAVLAVCCCALIAVVSRLRRRLRQLEPPPGLGLEAVRLGAPEIAARLAQLRLNRDAPPGDCAICDHTILGPHLGLRLYDREAGGFFEVEVCRYCLSEHAPDLLASLEAG